VTFDDFHLLIVCWTAAQFDAAKHLNTHPDLLGRSHNRLTLDKLKTVAIGGSADDESLSVCVIVNVQHSLINRDTRNSFWTKNERNRKIWHFG